MKNHQYRFQIRSPSNSRSVSSPVSGPPIEPRSSPPSPSPNPPNLSYERSNRFGVADEEHPRIIRPPRQYGPYPPGYREYNEKIERFDPESANTSQYISSAGSSSNTANALPEPRHTHTRNTQMQPISNSFSAPSSPTPNSSDTYRSTHGRRQLSEREIKMRKEEVRRSLFFRISSGIQHHNRRLEVLEIEALIGLFFLKYGGL